MKVLTDKKSMFFRVVVFATVLVFCASAGTPVRANPRSVTVPAGTTVVLNTVSAVSSAEARVGDRVDLTVVSDVVVDGRTVIRAGTVAVGEVTRAKKSGIVGSPGELAISVRSIPAVDNTTVYVSETRMVEGESKMTQALLIGLLCCILGLFIRGEQAEIPAGMTIHAVTMGAVTVSAR